MAEARSGRPAFIESPATSSSTAKPFGVRLAEAAQRQVDDFVVYNDGYRRISYPMGDVPALFGVCTDVIVRAYRALDIDLQRLVHEARVGSGDRNIDHRRTEVLRRFFAIYGDALPVSEFSEDYEPGDLITYYRPQNRASRAHIAIVSNVVAPSGRPMIIHNRGWGPQLEDGLFVDHMTGHFRYSGRELPPGDLTSDTDLNDRPQPFRHRMATKERIIRTSYVPKIPNAATGPSRSRAH